MKVYIKYTTDSTVFSITNLIVKNCILTGYLSQLQGEKTYQQMGLNLRKMK